jgi:hypothetical protein
MRTTIIFYSLPLLATLAPIPAAALGQRDEAAFKAWSERTGLELLREYERHLSIQKVQSVAPLHELLRTSSDWATPSCDRVGAQPFEFPPRENWDGQAKTLRLIKLLRARNVLPEFEIASAYRNFKIESCSGGAGRRHPTAGAFDLVPINPGDHTTTVQALCMFWRNEGLQHDMGLSVYPSGRIHIDTVVYSTWGTNGRKNTSVCLR